MMHNEQERPLAFVRRHLTWLVCLLVTLTLLAACNESLDEETRDVRQSMVPVMVVGESTNGDWTPEYDCDAIITEEDLAVDYDCDASGFEVKFARTETGYAVIHDDPTCSISCGQLEWSYQDDRGNMLLENWNLPSNLPCETDVSNAAMELYLDGIFGTGVANIRVTNRCGQTTTDTTVRDDGP